MSIKEEIVVSLKKQVTEINAIEARAVATIKERITREKIVPFNQEIDAARAKAESERAMKLNNDMKALQEEFARDKQSYYDAAEKKKAEYANQIMSTETYAITSECQKAIAKLKSEIEKLEE